MKIDVFAHILTPQYRERVLELLDARSDRAARNNRGAIRFDSTISDLDARWQLMDELGDDYRQVLVMGHFSVEQEGPAVARDLARIGNEELAAVAGKYPDRFVGWVAQTALQDDSHGLEAIEEALDAGALGVQVYTSVQGHSLDHPDHEAFFELMARRDRPIWIHPNRTWPDFPVETEPRYELYAMTGWPADTTVTMARLVFAGYLERWPQLKMIVHHSGGTVPMLAGRLTDVETAGGETHQVAARLKHSVHHYLKRFYADTANFGNPIALRAALEFFGPEHLLFGTDFGFDATFAPETIADVESVITDERVKQAIYEDNARQLLGLGSAASSG